MFIFITYAFKTTFLTWAQFSYKFKILIRAKKNRENRIISV